MSLKDDIESVRKRIHGDGTTDEAAAFHRIRARLEAAEKVAEEMRYCKARTPGFLPEVVMRADVARWLDLLSPPDPNNVFIAASAASPKQLEIEETEEVMPSAGHQSVKRPPATEPAVSSAAAGVALFLPTLTVSERGMQDHLASVHMQAVSCTGTDDVAAQRCYVRYTDYAALAKELDELRVEYSERYFGDTAEDAAIGRKWRENSALEEWFPLTAEELGRLHADYAAKVEECEKLTAQSDKWRTRFLKVQIELKGGDRMRQKLRQIQEIVNGQ